MRKTEVDDVRVEDGSRLGHEQLQICLITNNLVIRTNQEHIPVTLTSPHSFL